METVSLQSIVWTLLRIAAMLAVCFFIFASWPSSPERVKLEQHGVNLESDESGRVFAVGVTADALYDHIGEDIGMLKSLTRIQLKDFVCTDELFSAIAGLPNLQSISCRGCTISDEQLAMLNHNQLKSIDLSESIGLSRGLSALGQQEELRTLVLSGCQWLTDEELQCLSDFPKLEAIDVQNTQVTDDGIAALKSCARLENVTLSKCTRLTNTSLSYLQHCRELKSIRMYGVGIDLRAAAEFTIARPDTQLEYDQGKAPDLLRFFKRDLSSSITMNESAFTTLTSHYKSLLRVELKIPEDVSLLKFLPQLTSLGMTGPGVNDSVIPYIAEMPELKVLELSRSQLSDTALSQLPVFQQLEHIILTDTNISDSMLRWLAGNPRLRCLHLAGSSFDQKRVDEFLNFPALQYLDLCRTQNSQQILTRLQAPALVKIRLATCSLTDDDLSSLAAFPKLRAVDLSGNPFEGHGLKSLQELRLDTLDLHDSGLTDEGLKTISAFHRISIPSYPLMQLDVSGTSISGIGFLALGDVPIIGVKLNDLKLSSEGFDAICQLKSLWSLNLRRAVIPENSLQSLSKFPNRVAMGFDGKDSLLQAIAKGKTPPKLKTIMIHDADAKALDLLREFSDVETIGLSHCDIDEAAADMILRAPKCSRLQLLECRITDEAIHRLTSSKTLVRIELAGPDSASIDAEYLQRINPALSIKTISSIDSMMAGDSVWRVF